MSKVTKTISWITFAATMTAAFLVFVCPMGGLTSPLVMANGVETHSLCDEKTGYMRMDNKSPCAISLAGILNKLLGSLPESASLISLLIVLVLTQNFAKKFLLFDFSKTLTRFYHYYRFYLVKIKSQTEQKFLQWFNFIRSFEIAFVA